MRGLLFYVVGFLSLVSCSCFHSLLVAPTSSPVMAKGGKKGGGKKMLDIVSIEEDASDIWKIEKYVDVLNNGGVGVICTDTCYSFVTPITSQKGVDRLAMLKGMRSQKKPLSILCKDIAMISRYTSNEILGLKWAYKLLKSTLPGPYTYILPSSKETPKNVLEHNNHVKRFKRKEIGIRIPDDPICEYLLDRLDAPLLCGSVPEASEDVIGMIFAAIDADGDKEELEWRMGVEETNNERDFDCETDYMEDLIAMQDQSSITWTNQVNFIIENGPRGLKGTESLSTIVDLTSGRPIVIRQGKGTYDFDSLML